MSSPSPSPSPPPTSSSSSPQPPPVRRPRLCAPAPPHGLLASTPSKIRNTHPRDSDSSRVESNPQNPHVPQLRIYPFPPPTIPLTTPLTNPTSPDNCLRKRFLRRWRIHSRSNTSSASASFPSNVLVGQSRSRPSTQPIQPHSTCYNQTHPARPTHNPYDRVPSPAMYRYSDNARSRPTLDLVEGDPVLPLPASGGPASFSRLTTSIRKPRRAQQASRQRLELQSRIRSLRDLRRALEISRAAEITAVAAALRSHDVSRDDRVQLKADMERLSPEGVRASVELISRCFVAGLPRGKEVKLRLDLLPADVIRELQLVIMQENNQVNSASASQLRTVCMELNEAVKENGEKICP